MSLAISVWGVVGEMVFAWTFQGRLKACQGPPRYACIQSEVSEELRSSDVDSGLCNIEKPMFTTS